MSTEPKPEYDARLLADAPAATRAAKQEGYDVDILHQRDSPQPEKHLSTAAQAPVFLPGAPANGSAGSLHPQLAPEQQQQQQQQQRYADAKRTPWHRTPRGIALLVVGALVIIGAVVGGAVGGTVGKHHHSANAVSSPGSGNNGVGQGQGQGSSDAVPVGQATSTSTATAADGVGVTIAQTPTAAAAVQVQQTTPKPRKRRLR